MLLPVAATVAHLLWASPLAEAGPIPWVHDDWAAAAARAQAEGKTVAVDVWATWCHTCLSMTNFVFTDPAFSKVADKHVWLALDYDLEKNAAFFERHPVSAFPTFLVITPKDDRVISRWAGSGDVDEMITFFSHAQAGDDPLSRGGRALADKRLVEARQIFESALKTKGDPSTHTRLLLGWIEALYSTDKPACATLGAERLSETEDTAQGADFAVLVGYCAFELEDKALQKAVLNKVIARLAPLAKNKEARLAVDDRSSILGSLQEAYEALGQKAKAAAAVKARLTLLAAAANAAESPAARATFDDHRMQAYLQVGRVKDAVKMLESSEKSQPKDFNHPWRLAKVHLQSKRWAAGLAAIDRALDRGYGGRKLRLYSTKIELQLGAGQVEQAVATAREGQAHLKGLNEAQVRPFWRAEFEAQAKRATESRS